MKNKIHFEFKTIALLVIISFCANTFADNKPRYSLKLCLTSTGGVKVHFTSTNIFDAWHSGCYIYDLPPKWIKYKVNREHLWQTSCLNLLRADCFSNPGKKYCPAGEMNEDGQKKFYSGTFKFKITSTKIAGTKDAYSLACEKT